MASSSFLDYCLTCDRQTAGEAYCSQECRLAELCNPPASSPLPVTPPTARSLSTARSSNGGFFLPPAFDFSAYRHSTSSVPSSSSSPPPPTTPRPSSEYFGFATTGSLLCQSEAAKRSLTPSSSRSSLGSIGEEAKSELREWGSKFDMVREGRRKRTNTYESCWRT